MDLSGVRATHGGKSFGSLAVLLIETQELSNNRGNRPGRHSHDLAREAHAVGIHFAAKQELIVRSLLFTNFPDVAVKPISAM